MRVGFVEGVLAVMVFRFMFNVCSLPMGVYTGVPFKWRVYTGKSQTKMDDVQLFPHDLGSSSCDDVQLW